MVFTVSLFTLYLIRENFNKRWWKKSISFGLEYFQAHLDTLSTTKPNQLASNLVDVMYKAKFKLTNCIKNLICSFTECLKQYLNRKLV